ncbi:phage tail protein [Paenibacillus sp. DMB20]|uniref:phage tail protein n=1 Tax=Paenibacillus sp. DMB20 TaxID=1642570 RepID=UPI000627D6BE|nr:tail fiber protein [Paenibacillus sp. DMB20]KKO54595.1 tail collar protein [Paenibacillus sp. DMB20]
MSEAYLGEIRMFAGNYAPQGWALCNGQLLSISENETLFNLIGTTYGGDGQTTFALPDLQGRIPIHRSSDYMLGNRGGTESVFLTPAQLPEHTHVPHANGQAGPEGDTPHNSVWAPSVKRSYSDGSGKTPVSMNRHLLSPAGSGQPHDNMMPSAAISFIISLYGMYPPHN